MIKLIDVSKKFGDTTVIKNIDLSINKGELFVIIGPSGSGKTTIMKMINKMEKPTSGRIFVDNIDISTINSVSLRRRIGYVIQNIGLLPHMSVRDNVAIVPKLLKFKKGDIDRIVYEMLTLVELEPDEYLDKYPFQLSGGQSQRVGIARALAANPSIVLMDEPFGSLDPITRQHLQNQIVRIQKSLKKTVLFVTHDIDEAIKIADRVAIIKDGSIVQIDEPKKLLSDPKDDFVVNFLGTDRALKKLSKVSISTILKKPQTIDKSSLGNIGLRNYNYLWVTDSNGILMGWADRNSKGNRYVEVDFNGFALEMDATLKDALSQMVYYSVRCLPVCDSNGKIAGEIDLLDIIEYT